MARSTSDSASALIGSPDERQNLSDGRPRVKWLLPSSFPHCLENTVSTNQEEKSPNRKRPGRTRVSRLPADQESPAVHLGRGRLQPHRSDAPDRGRVTVRGGRS